MIAATPLQSQQRSNPAASPIGQRIGEASHPGPAHQFPLRISTSNPGGLRGKEAHIIDLGPGIHQMSETHLSSVTGPRSASTCKHLARAHNRQVQFHTGSNAPLRQRSTWAGTWTGVATLSDLTSTTISLGWPQDIWDTGRVQATLHFIGPHRLLLVNIYGFPRGPTWPAARALNAAILQHVTQQITLGYHGLAAISGDFNMNPGEDDHTKMWAELGWKEAQSWAFSQWGQPISPTCQGVHQRDQLWMSPALTALCTEVKVSDIFLGHSTVLASFNIDMAPQTFLAWPRPTPLPWDQIEVTTWQQQAQATPYQAGQCPTQFYRQFGREYEASFKGFYSGTPDATLPAPFLGRGHHTRPMLQSTSPRTCRASRSGEATLQHGLTGRAVTLWYQQLRRLQSLRHPTRADKHTSNAVVYRIELWAAIRRAPGFKPSFPDWWQQQALHTDAGLLPLTVPTPEQMEHIYYMYEAKFRDLESWHLRQRNKQLAAKYDRTHKALFADLKPPKRPTIQSLAVEKDYQILAFSEDGTQVHLDGEALSAEHSHWHIDYQPLCIQQTDGEMITLGNTAEHHIDSIITQTAYTVTQRGLMEQLEQFWHPRWYKVIPPTEHDWQRIISFVQAYMPRGCFSFPDISISTWRRSVRRFKAHAARGADGYDKSDMTAMTDSQIEAVLSLLRAIEHQQTSWPTQLLTSLAIALGKKDHPQVINDYRPIILFSMWYRAWSSLRARQFLKQLIHSTHEDAVGFMPGCETAQIWLSLQATIELSIQAAQPLSGLSTDIIKAFEHIGRPQLFHLLTHIGAPDTLTAPWSSFLDHFERRFTIGTTVGRPCKSTTGVPEGCPLSVAGMAALDWAMHVYLQHFVPHARTQSFVDNITISAHSAHIVASAFFALRAFFEAWGMQLDHNKTYTWGTDPRTRADIQPLGFSVVQDAIELGGNMVFGASHRNRHFLARGQSMNASWQRLSQSRAPLRQKLYSLPACFWSKALHAAANCVFSSTHLTKWRTQAMKALHIQTAGASPLIRLSLSQPQTADPGYYQLLHVILDTRRICHKSPTVLLQWRHYMVHYEGKLHRTFLQAPHGS